MDWQEKLQALQSLCETSVLMRSPGNWYVYAQGREVGGDGLRSGTSGEGATPEDAVEDDWRLLVETLPREKYIIVSFYPYSSQNKRYVRWDGFIWADVGAIDG